jgi:hypothetical protein
MINKINYVISTQDVESVWVFDRIVFVFVKDKSLRAEIQRGATEFYRVRTTSPLCEGEIVRALSPFQYKERKKKLKFQASG